LTQSSESTGEEFVLYSDSEDPLTLCIDLGDSSLGNFRNQRGGTEGSRSEDSADEREGIGSGVSSTGGLVLEFEQSVVEFGETSGDLFLELKDNRVSL